MPAARRFCLLTSAFYLLPYVPRRTPPACGLPDQTGNLPLRGKGLNHNSTMRNQGPALPRTSEAPARPIPKPLVKRIRTSNAKPKRDLLVGKWSSGDEYYSDVEFTIRRSGGSYVVQVCDGFDGEKADVFETAWDGRILAFAAHWNTTGRFARYRLLLLSDNRVQVTYTYTDNEMYHRKRTKRST
jgi:hypothetical protein